MKIASYPLSTFVKALELAKAVDSLGDNCAHATCATKLDKKLSGGFTDLISSAVKYGLVTNKKTMLTLTKSYKDHKLSYTPEEEQAHLRKLFLNPPLFQEIYTKYNSVGLPYPEVLEKALVREFGVPDKFAKRTATYFLNGAKYVGLLNEHNSFISESSTKKEPPSMEKGAYDATSDSSSKKESESKNYTVQIVGPSIDSRLTLTEESDLLILDAILTKVKNKLMLGKKDTIKDENHQSTG